MNNDFLEIINSTGYAPSGHNTQPWRFSLAENKISILPDFEVTLPVVDGCHRELYISLGCATENLLIAAAHWGYETCILRCDVVKIEVELTESYQVAEDYLFRQIEQRQTNRSVYSGEHIINGRLRKLQSVSGDANIQIYFAEIGSPFADKLTEYIVKGNEVQMSSRAFKEELLSWMRFNGGQVKETGDGLSYKVFKNPPLPKLIAKSIVRQFLNPDRQNKEDVKKINSSSHLVLLTTKYNTVEEWIGLGRLLQRFVLTATELGVACAYLNQPCEVVSLAHEMQETLSINGEYPTLILRIGYADLMPYSPRKKVKIEVE